MNTQKTYGINIFLLKQLQITFLFLMISLII